MVKQVDELMKPSIKQIRELLEYIYTKEKEIHKVFDIVKFADNMMFDNTGFPIMHCGAGINAISILPNGDVFPCVKCEKIEYKICNIFNDGAISEIYNNARQILKNELVEYKDSCRECEIKYLCGGGCRAEEINGHICEYNCNYFKLAKDIFMEKIIAEAKLYDGKNKTIRSIDGK